MKDYSTKKRYGNLRTAKETSITKRSPASPFGAMLASYLIPFLSWEKIPNISVLDPVSAHIELIERNNVLREVVSNVIISTKLTVDRFFRCRQVSDLNIQLFAALVAYKINFLIACSADSHFIHPHAVIKAWSNLY